MEFGLGNRSFNTVFDVYLGGMRVVRIQMLNTNHHDDDHGTFTLASIPLLTPLNASCLILSLKAA